MSEIRTICASDEWAQGFALALECPGGARFAAQRDGPPGLSQDG